MKILTVFTGGTIACSRGGGALFPNEANAFALLDGYRERGGDAEFVTAKPYYILSENLSAENLNALYHCITSYDLSEYDGVIVAHGTDTLQYTAAYLGYKLCKADLPIVLVSANYPLSDSRSNGFENFSAAVDLIRTRRERGVFAAYRNTPDSFVTIHRGTMLLPHLPFSDNLFSVNDNYFGRVENGEFIQNADCQSDDTEDMSSCELNGCVLYIRAYPGIRYPNITHDTKAILLEGFHSGTLNTQSKELADFCKQAKERELPIYLAGSAEGFEYESKAEFESLKINVLPPISPIAAYMKLWLSDTIIK